MTHRTVILAAFILCVTFYSNRAQALDLCDYFPGACSFNYCELFPQSCPGYIPQPDFQVLRLISACAPTDTNVPAVYSVIRNVGDAPGRVSVDQFVDPPGPVYFGDSSIYYGVTPIIQPNETLRFKMNVPTGYLNYDELVWVYVILNSDREHPEAYWGNNSIDRNSLGQKMWWWRCEDELI